jgi:hypothetical protein
LDFGPRWEVVQLYPSVRGAHEPVQAGLSKRTRSRRVRKTAQLIMNWLS